MDPTRLARTRHPCPDVADAEAALWQRLRAHRFAAFRFRRQHPCGPFILDFFCASRRLAVELDSQSRRLQARRTRYLVARGITILRFSSDLVRRDLDGVLMVIEACLITATPRRSPSRRAAP